MEAIYPIHSQLPAQKLPWPPPWKRESRCWFPLMHRRAGQGPPPPKKPPTCIHPTSHLYTPSPRTRGNGGKGEARRFKGRKNCPGLAPPFPSGDWSADDAAAPFPNPPGPHPFATPDPPAPISPHSHALPSPVHPSRPLCQRRHRLLLRRSVHIGW